ncbi:MAG: two component transcriptional regulator, LuxR family [Bryobacterales bacterium]|nr:two component transcriptional regulator, LuxR family [Bryobacterales bacterium]
MASILCYSDQPILALGLREILSAPSDLELIDCCTTRDQLMDRVSERQPDLLFLDLTPDFTLEFLTAVHKTVKSAKIVLWVHFISTEMALQAMGVGVRGIISKTLTPDVVITSLRKIHEGELWFEKALTDSILTARRYTLTRREGQIVTLVAQGLKNKELGIALNISEGTVKVYLSRLFKKLGLKDRFELALFGLKNLTTGYGTQSSTKSGNRPAPFVQGGQDPRAFFVERSPIQGVPSKAN